jgi:AcrR family transcriptional regulator
LRDTSDARAALRDRILLEIRALFDRDGVTPGRDKFLAHTGLKDHQLISIWPSWNDAVRDAGLEPNALNAAIPTEQLLSALADLTHEIKRFPGRPQIQHAGAVKLGFPNHKTFSNRFGTRDEMFQALVKWAHERDNAELLAILEVTPASRVAKPQRASASIASTEPVSLSESYVPPVVAILPALSRGDEQIVARLREAGVDENVTFERRVGLAFEILGLRVQRLGQGSGRAPDGVAKSPDGSWAIVYDAKVRRGGYNLGTEDRKFREYIDTHGKALRGEGLRKLYFVVVSGSFSEADLPRATELTRITHANACTFVTASALVDLVEKRIRDPLTFDLDALERAFAQTRILE